ncbi:MAG: nucleotide pyrophosphohydrolase [Clostridia bacterium]|nr:nucleotide pyrophosphohydrolase [Clostridia bacterium]
MRNEKERLAALENFNFEDLVSLVRVLRGPEGCPWDQAQGHHDLRNNMVEEAYEVCEGIDRDNNELLCEELGDVLLQVVFHAGIAEDENAFTTEDVIGGICRKMIRRHPHVFEEGQEQESWEELKRREKGERSQKETLARISRAFPSLTRAKKFLEKGVSAPEAVPALRDKKEAGEALFALVAACRAKGIDPEEALNGYLNDLL